MNTYICKCGRRVKKSTNADNTGNRLKGYGPPKCVILRGDGE